MVVKSECDKTTDFLIPNRCLVYEYILAEVSYLVEQLPVPLYNLLRLILLTVDPDLGPGRKN